MTDFVMTVGGETIPTGDSFGVRNPATGEVFARAPECGKEQLDAAFDAAAEGRCATGRTMRQPGAPPC